jgi:hypothetical protein
LDALTWKKIGRLFQSSREIVAVAPLGLGENQMGKELECKCTYGGHKFQVKAILEAKELILRGEWKKRILRTSMSAISTADGCLRFKVAGEEISLALGEIAAEKWCKALLSPPPSLATKLGITATTSVYVIGEIDDGNLHDALQTASQISAQTGDLMIARVNTPNELSHLRKLVSRPGLRRPLWVIYPKGSRSWVSEADIRSAFRAMDFVDTKVASISEKLTGLRFSPRKKRDALQ